jgi:hypothetical protein
LPADSFLLILLKFCAMVCPYAAKPVTSAIRHIFFDKNIVRFGRTGKADRGGQLARLHRVPLIGD